MANDSTVMDRIRLTIAAIRAHPTGRVAFKVAIALIGGIVVIAGIILIPLPGPGWLIVIAGLAIWAVEFVWARHLLHFTRERLRRWWDWVGRQSLAVRMLIGAAGLIFVGAVAATTLKLSFGVNIVGDAWRYITTH